MDRLRALMLLEECTGHDLWSVEHCRQRRIPESWIDEMADAYESSFFSERSTIYVEDQRVNQYFGIHDLELAIRLASELGVDVARYQAMIFERGALVQALKEAAEDD